jgi:alanine dehydrogenase
MKVLIINQSEARDLLSMEECIAVMEQAFMSLAKGKAIQPLRMAMSLPGGKILAMMPSFIEDIDSMGAKVITVFPGNHGTEYDAHQGIVLLFETGHGCLRAIVDGTAITGIRTAAVSAVATKLLARADTRTMAILGAGTQARAHLDAMRILFEFEKVHVWSIFPEEALRFARDESRRTGMDIRAAGTAEEAVEDHDLICTTTPAKDPILMGRWIKPGAHINAIGACNPFARELDTEALRRSKLFVDRMESALNEAGDFIIPKKEGAIDAESYAMC